MAEALCVALGILFVSSSVPKLRRPRTFRLIVVDLMSCPCGPLVRTHGWCRLPS